jgi:hypothetical protein
MRCEFGYRATGARVLDEHENAHQSSTSRHHTFRRAPRDTRPRT